MFQCRDSLNDVRVNCVCVDQEGEVPIEVAVKAKKTDTSVYLMDVFKSVTLLFGLSLLG